jgi:hypothetical protein
MKCEYLTGEIQEIQEVNEGIKITIKFDKWEPTFTLTRGDYHIRQINKLRKGTKIHCIFLKNSILWKIFLEPAFDWQSKN